MISATIVVISLFTQVSTGNATENVVSREPVPASIAAGSGGARWGTEPGFWDEMFLIVGEVESRRVNDTHYETVRLKPLACLAGNFDPTEKSVIDIRAWRVEMDSKLGVDSRSGITIVMLCYTENGQFLAVNALDRIVFVNEIDPTNFRGGVVVASGLGDLKVRKLIDRVRELRTTKVPQKRE